MHPIDLEKWPRRAIFEHFSRMSRPFYSLTFDVDVTRVRDFAKANQVSFYLTLTWLVTRACNRVPALCQDIRDGVLWQLDGRIPSFTDLKPGSECFHIVTVPMEDDPITFAKKAAAASAAQGCFLDMSKEGSDLLFISCVPWLHVTALTNEREPDTNDCIPRFTWGKWEERNGRKILGMCVEVNHRTVDGIHIGQFAKALEEEITGLAV
ncbi:MAG: chloramphenicol acetyltransferase [Clostridia bacterium]|nr:chloramphenicol acetyltransferase [Clostridia bacterium]